MNNRQENKYRSYLSIQAVCDENVTVFKPLKAFVQTYAEFSARVAAIGQLRITRETVTTGVAADKQRLREEMCQAAFEIAGATRAYAIKASNLELAGKVEYSLTSLVSGRDAASADRCQNVHDAANETLDALETFGVTEEKLGALQEKIDAYKATIPKPRKAIATAKTATEQLVEEFAAADKLLSEGLDKLIVQFQTAVPKFFSDYLNARAVVDTAATVERGETPPPTAKAA